MKKRFRSFLYSKDRRGVALVITLAFVVMVTVVIVAYFTRTISETQLSTNSAGQTKVDLFTQGAVDTIVGDLQQEIAAGSVGVTPSPSPQSGVIYKPTVPLTMVPWRTGLAAQSNPNCVNLVKESLFQNGASVPFYPSSVLINSTNAYGASTNYPPPSRASNIPSDKALSFNGRSISLERWNKPLLMPITTSTDYTPSAASGTTPNVYTAPDWILVTRSGSNPIITSTNQTIGGNLQWSGTGSSTVVGRYAYNVYDEGGLLDMNVAGYPVSPSTTSTNQFAQLKPGLSYADLTQVGLTQQQVDAVVGWRNYSSMQLSSGSFPNYNNDTFPAAYGTNYYNYVVSNNNGFLGVSGTLDTGNGSQSSAGQTDRAFATRQQLIAFLLDTTSTSNQPSYLSTLNALQYLGTFSRGLNQPSYIRLQSTNSNKTLDYNASVPKLLPGGQTAGGTVNTASQGGNSYGGLNRDDQINPSFPGLRVITPFTRNDGSTAVVGEPLVKSRFPLERLAWVTYEGPSATVIQTSGTNDANIQALVNYGIPLSYLEQGTPLNIQKYFGLTWAPDPTDTNSEWHYNVHNGPTGNSTTGPIMLTGSLAAVTSPREPDFFELLKASINAGCLGKSLIPYNGFMGADNPTPPAGGTQGPQPYNYNYYLEFDLDAQVIQIGVNMITQYQPANFPIRVNFNDGSPAAWMGTTSSVGHTFAGVANLPYLYELLAGNLQVDQPSPLPSNGRNTYNNSAGSGTPGNSGYPTAANANGNISSTITNSGLAACLQLPVVWNPTDPACPTTTATGANTTVEGASNGKFGATPIEVRVVADSCVPDQTSDYVKTQTFGSTINANSVWGFFGYGRSKGTTAGGGYGEYSCNADPTSPGDSNGGTSSGNTWFRDTSSTMSGANIQHYLWTPPGSSPTSIPTTYGIDEIDMTLKSGSGYTWCPEPVLLYKSSPTNSAGNPINANFSDLNGNAYRISVPSYTLMASDPATKGFFALSGSGLPYIYKSVQGPQSNAPNMGSSEPQEKGGSAPANGIYIGLELGAFPYAWYCPANLNTVYSGTIEGVSAQQSSGYCTRCVLSGQYNPPGNDTDGYMTYRMQYLDPGTQNWITYDMKYGKVSNDQVQNGLGTALTTTAGNESTLLCGFENNQGGEEGYWAGCTDPRTSRFGFFWSSTQGNTNIGSSQNASIDSNGNTATPPPGPEMELVWGQNGGYAWAQEDSVAQGWIDPGNAILYTMRPDAQAGHFFCAQSNDNDDGWPYYNPGNPTGQGVTLQPETNATGQNNGWMAFVYSDNHNGTTSTFNGAYTGLAPELLEQNNTDIFFEPVRFYGALTGADNGDANASTPNYFADPDGIVRRAMGAFVPSGIKTSPSTDKTLSGSVYPSAATTVGLPTARVFSWNPNDSAGPTGAADPTINPLSPRVLANNQSQPPTLTVTNQAQSRPYFLHRPFRSVADIGYVFSDTPWRNMDLFTAESGYSALLDVFCVNDETGEPSGLVAGKVNLNTRQQPVLQAIFAGAYMDPAQPGLTLLTGGTQVGLTASLSGTLAEALVARTSDTNNIINGTGPLENMSDLIGKWVASKAIVPLSGLQNSQGVLASNIFFDGKLSYAGFSGGVWNNQGESISLMHGPVANSIENFSSSNGAVVSTGSNLPEDVYSAYSDYGQFSNPSNLNGGLQTAGTIERFREAPIRALSSVGQTRVWNLLIDVIAQTGRYSRSTTNPASFIVEGEQRYWVHVAIDRFTGQVLDKQVEVVKE